ncbi:MAG: NosD domain-containing protein [Candidatus Hermodarchaeota archaeon]
MSSFEELKKIKYLILVLGLLIAVSSISMYYFGHIQSGNSSNIEILDGTRSGPPKASGSWVLDNITIDPTGATPGSLAWTEAVGLPAGWCSGAGTWDDPYIIENVTIDASTSPTECGIYINNSKNDYFVINNVTVYNAVSGGITLENTNNGTLVGNICSSNYEGILFYNCVNNTISGNDVLENTDCGIYLENCYNNTLLGNFARNNHKDGIGLAYSNNNTLLGNTASDNPDLGIYLWYCNNINLSGNLVSNNLYCGFWIYYSARNTFFNNTASYNWHNGMEFIGSENNSIIKNTIQNNKYFGIELFAESNFNRIFNNILIHNFEGCIKDYCTGNIHENNICIGSSSLDLGRILLLLISIFLILIFIFYIFLGFFSLEKYLSRRKKEKKSMNNKDNGKAVKGFKQLMGFFDLLNDHVMDLYKAQKKLMKLEDFFELLDKSGLDAKKIKMIEEDLND